MKKEYIIINSKKLKIPNWSKWIILFLCSSIVQIAIPLLGLLIGFRIGLECNTIYQISWFISAIITLTLIYDLAPKFKKFFSALVSFVYIVLLFGMAPQTGWITFIIIILYNILLYKKKIMKIRITIIPQYLYK